jgi:hypothetical protein
MLINYTGKIGASFKEPVMVCKTCKCITKKVLIRRSEVAIKDKRKTWKRIIKNTLLLGNRLFFSYAMQDCLAKKHKLSIRQAPFRKSEIVKPNEVMQVI